MNKKIVSLLIAVLLSTSIFFVLVPESDRASSTPVTLTVGIVSPGAITNLNPWEAGGQSAITTDQLRGLYYLTLMLQAPNGTLMPQLAQSWSANANATVYTFNLVPNLKWSDGTPLTANDVVYSFRLLQQHPLFDTLNGFIVGSLLKNVTALSSTSVQFTLTHPFSPFLDYASLGKYIVPEHIFSAISNITAYTGSSSPVGDGPYLLVNWTPGSTVLHYKANPYFYMGKPKIANLAVELLSPTANIPALLQTGEITLAQPSPSQVAALSGVSHVGVSVSPGISIVGTYFDPAGLFMFDDALYPYNITTVRQALAYSINRTQIVQLALNGYGTAGNQGQLPPSLSQWIPSTLANYTFNPSKARSMLLGLGFKNGSNGYLTFPNGTAWTPKIMDVGGTASSVVSVIVQNLHAAGIDASESVVTIGTIVHALEYGTFDMILLGTSRPPIPDFVLGVFVTNSVTPVGTQELDYHGWARWSNQTVWNDLNQARNVSGFSQQYQLYANVQQIMATQVPLIVLYYGQNIWAYSNATISGWGPAAQGYQFPQAPLLMSLHGPATVATSNNGAVYAAAGLVVVLAVIAVAVYVLRKRQR